MTLPQKIKEKLIDNRNSATLSDFIDNACELLTAQIVFRLHAKVREMDAALSNGENLSALDRSRLVGARNAVAKLCVELAEAK